MHYAENINERCVKIRDIWTLDNVKGCEKGRLLFTYVHTGVSFDPHIYLLN
jgi:hypothetical protein